MSQLKLITKSKYQLVKSIQINITSKSTLTMIFKSIHYNALSPKIIEYFFVPYQNFTLPVFLK